MIHYFFELRNRFIYSFLTLTFLSGLSFNYRETLLFLLVKPSLFIFETNLPYFIYTDLTEIFISYIHLAVSASIYIYLPFIIHHSWKFLNPGFYKTEYLYLKHIVYGFYAIWVIITLAVHYFLLPHLWEFFSGFDTNIFQGPLGLHFEAKLNEYVSFLIYMYLYSCFGSQICVFIIICILNVNPHDLIYIRKLRRYIYVISFFVAALITPPDILSQVIIAICILFIYEILIFLLLLKNEYVIYIWGFRNKTFKHI